MTSHIAGTITKVHISKEYVPPEWKKKKKTGSKRSGTISNAKSKTNASYYARRMKPVTILGCGCQLSLEKDILKDCNKEYCENV